MNLLFTSDWQAETSNLEKCEQVVQDILRIQVHEKIDAVIHCGDFKQHYNPIDTRVANFGVSTAQRLSARSLFKVLLGNHDRIGMHSDDKNWFPVLQSAGASVYDQPDVCVFEDSALFILPFISDHDKLVAHANTLMRMTSEKRMKGKTKILTFHETIRGCGFNSMTKANEARVTLKDLCVDAYDFCIGGDIHMHQKLGRNLWYIGSPFPINWGEANQRKGYLLLKTDTKELRFIDSSIPRLYDETWPGFKDDQPKNWQGTGVRIHVPCDSQARIDVGAVLSKAKAHAEKKYLHANIVVIPEFVNTGIIPSEELIPVDASDKAKIRAYVKQACPIHLKEREKDVIAYLADKLAITTGPLRSRGRLRLISASAKNFLSYKKLSVDFAEPGIVLVTGQNKDWMNRSNGSGKTSFLQPVAVALFGRTFKKQKADGWRRRGSKDTAKVKLVMTLPDDSPCEITRQRKPTKTIIERFGHDDSSGNSKGATDEQIQQLTGYTWSLLSNVMYLDPHELTMLSGTDKERKEILEQFQNLERFIKAGDLIKRDMFEAERKIGNLTVEIEAARSRRQTIREFITEQKKSNLSLPETKNKVAELKRQWKTLQQSCGEEKAKLEARRERLTVRLKDIQAEATEARLRQMTASSTKHELENRLAKLLNSGICPLCKQPVKRPVVETHAEEMREQLGYANADIKKAKGEQRELYKRIQPIEQKIIAVEEALDLLDGPLIEHQRWVEEATSDLAWAEQQASQLVEQQQKLKKVKASITAKKTEIIATKVQLAMYQFATETMSRNGLPAFLNGQLVPQLNNAAEFYAELFADKEIQVRFTVHDGEFDVEVINPNGGETIGAQSTGETKVAALITSFALREVAAMSNVLILDEPGEGLDPCNAQKFAAGLKKVAKRLGTVFVTSHNAAILAELSGERHIEITKSNGVSTANIIV